MAEEQQVVDPQTTVEQDSQAEQDAFSASFNTEARADEAPAQVENTEVATETAEVTAEVEGAQAAETEAPKAEDVGVTTEQLTAMLAKLPKMEEAEQMTTAEIRKLYGKLGEINRVVQDLQKNGEGGKPAVKLAGANLKRLHEQYPDLAELLAEDLNESASGASETQTQDTSNLDERVAQVKNDLSKEMQHNLLMIQHRDYPAVIQSDEFKVWIQTLPQEEQVKLNDSWDAMYLGEKFTEFKGWRDKKQTGTNQRRERLERAITPIGTQKALVPQAQTEQDGFNAAFNKK
jgi:hypothetical protein